MIRILYISTARSALPDAELRAILEKSRRNNAAVDVTGLLVVGGRRFLQALEGPADAVTAVYQRIAADPRHFAVVQLSNKTITDRAFANWSMGFQSGGVASATASLEDQVAAIVAPIDDANLRAYFSDFAKRHKAA